MSKHQEVTLDLRLVENKKNNFDKEMKDAAHV